MKTLEEFIQRLQDDPAFENRLTPLTAAMTL